MSSDHYLAGPCDGISIHREGVTVTVKDVHGREDLIVSCVSEVSAAHQVWKIRGDLYAKYDHSAAPLLLTAGAA